jgi:hypothetical protein
VAAGAAGEDADCELADGDGGATEEGEDEAEAAMDEEDAAVLIEMCVETPSSELASCGAAFPATCSENCSKVAPKSSRYAPILGIAGAHSW